MSSNACVGAHRTVGASCLLLHALCNFGRQPRLQRHRQTGAKSQVATRQVASRKAQGPGPTPGKSHAGAHKGLKHEDPKRGPPGGIKTGRKARVTARCVIQKIDFFFWCHAAVPLLGPPKGQVARQFVSTWLPPMQPSAQQPSPAQQPSAQHKPSPAAVGTAAEPSPSQPRPAAQPRARILRRFAKSSFTSTCNHHGHRGAHMHARICASAVQESLIEGKQTLCLLSKLATLRNVTRDSQEDHRDAVSSMA